MADKKEDFEEKVSYVLGIISIVIFLFSPLLGLISGIVGFNMSKKSAGPLAKRANKISKTGIILNIIILALVIIAGIYAVLTGWNLPTNPLA